MLKLLAVALLAAPLFAQQVTESIEVRVVNVDVIVTDAEGKRVTGLTAADFEVLEDNRPQTITNFYEVREGSTQQPEGAPLPAPPRSFIFFLDNESLHPYNRKLIVNAIRKFVDTELRAEDSASVIAWNRAVKVLAPSTNNKAALKKALDEADKLGAPSGITSDLARVQRHCVRTLDRAKAGQIPYAHAYEDCINTSRGEMMATALHSRQLLNAVELTMTTVAGLEGRKMLVLAGARLPKTPGIEIYQWANQLFTPFMRGFDGAMRQPDQEDEQQEFLKRVALAANAHGVTLYTIGATISADNQSADQKEAVDDLGADFLNQVNTFDSFETLSSMTGGATFKRPSDFDATIASIAAESESYYSLGYRPRESTGGNRAMTVRAKNRNLKVRTRETRALKTADEQMSDRVVANLFVPAAPTPWKARVATGDLEKAGANFKVPFEVTIPSDALTLLPNGTMRTGGYTVYVAVGTAQGALSTVFRQPEKIDIQADQEAAFRKEPLTFGATLTVRPGENILSVGVVDHFGGGMAFARAPITARLP